MKPLPENPTNGDLANGITQLHECLEEHRKFTAKNIRTVQNQTRQSNKNQKLIKASVNDIKITVENLQTKFITEDPKHKPFILMGQKEALFKVFLAVGAAMGAVSACWKFIGFSLPYGWHFLIALNTFYMGK